MSAAGPGPPDRPASTASSATGRRRQAWLVAVLAAMIAAAAVTAVVSRLASPRARPAVAHSSLPPSRATYLGVYEPGVPHSYQAVARFAKVAGRQPGLVGYFSGWAAPFALSFAQQARGHGAVPLVQIDPTYASVQAIAAGAYDTYLRAYADSVRHFGHAVVIGFGHEMNAPWYSWGYGHVPPASFVAAWRHIVTLFRARGASNVIWLWTINAGITSTGPLTAWWPGAGYVSWVGIDGYYYRSSDTFSSVFGSTIRRVRAFAAKPVLLSETAVGPGAGQAARIANLFAGMRRSSALGLVWFDMRQRQGIYHQDWRLEDHPAAEAAFRQAVRTELARAR